MTQKQWKMISTIISIIIVVVFALYKAFGEQKATNKSIRILHRKRLKMLLILHLRERILITLKA